MNNQIILGHWTTGGTGITNIDDDRHRRAAIYNLAAKRLNMTGITVSTVDMDGNKGMWSLHDTEKRGDLSNFWEEVRKLENIKDPYNSA